MIEMIDSNESQWVVVCKDRHQNIIKVVGPFETDAGAHDWKDENWDKNTEIRKVLPP